MSVKVPLEGGEVATFARQVRSRGADKMRRARAEERGQTARKERDKVRKQVSRARSRYAGMSVGQAVAEYARSRLTVPTGLLRGQAVELLPWQIEFLDALYQDGKTTAALSIGRKNGKTSLISILALAHLDPRAPLHTANVRLGFASTTESLAQIAADCVLDLAAAAGLELRYRRSPRPVRIENETGGKLVILACEKSQGLHGLSLDLSLLDEAGKFEGRFSNHRDTWQSAISSVSATGGRCIQIGTRLTGDLFDASLRDKSDAHVVRRYAAPEDCSLTDRDAWQAANPSLGSVKSESYMRGQASRAQGDRVSEQGFRAHDLNQAVDDAQETLVVLGEWRACVVDKLPPREGMAYVGIDVGGTAAQTAAAAYWPESGRLDAVCAFPAVPGLADRGDRDQVGDLYQRMESKGELVTVGNGKLVPLPAFMRLVEGMLDGAHVAHIGADRYRQAEVSAALMGTPHAAMPWTWRGTGAHSKADGSADIRAFIGAVRERRIAVRETLVWPAAISGSRLRFDGAGNPALDKQRSRSRIDLVQAAVIACGLAAHSRRPDFEPVFIDF